MARRPKPNEMVWDALLIYINKGKMLLKNDEYCITEYEDYPQAKYSIKWNKDERLEIEHFYYNTDDKKLEEGGHSLRRYINR